MAQTYGFSMKDKAIREYRAGFNVLSDADKRIAVMLAHNINTPTVAERAGVSQAELYNRRDVIAASLRCAPDELPRAVLAAVGVIGAYSI